MATINSLDRDFFARHCVGDPDVALQVWERWHASHPHAEVDTKIRKVMSIASDLGEASIRHYFHPKHQRYRKVSRQKRDQLDEIMRDLGQTPPERHQKVGGPPVRTSRATTLALLSELYVPSETYHLELIRGMVHVAGFHNLSLSVHESTSASIPVSVRMAVRKFHPDGIVMLRLTPDRATLEFLQNEAVPVVLIHADRFRYAPPVLTNLVPDQDLIPRQLTEWLEGLPHLAGRSEGGRRKPSKAVVIAMPNEQPHATEFAPLGATDPSIRNERKRLIRKALAEFKLNAFEVEVEDYSFRHAARVMEAHPEASVYVALSDQLAVGIKQWFIAKRKDKDWRTRVIGFDASPLAKSEGIPSFSQQLPDVSRLAVEILCKFFSSPPAKEWPEFKETRTPIILQQSWASQ